MVPGPEHVNISKSSLLSRSSQVGNQTELARHRPLYTKLGFYEAQRRRLREEEMILEQNCILGHSSCLASKSTNSNR
jgi:hypothetical protein